MCTYLHDFIIGSAPAEMATPHASFRAMSQPSSRPLVPTPSKKAPVPSPSLILGRQSGARGEGRQKRNFFESEGGEGVW